LIEDLRSIAAKKNLLVRHSPKATAENCPRTNSELSGANRSFSRGIAFGLQLLKTLIKL